MAKRTLITGATVILPEGAKDTTILIEGSRIAQIGVTADADHDEKVDATGKVLMPGVIDHHVHFRDPGVTHKEDLHTGSIACAAGGVTTFFEMPNTSPATTSIETLHAKLDIASSKSVVNYGFYIGATPHNLDDLKAAERSPGIKIFIGSSTGDLLVDKQETLEAIFEQTTLPICAHCEDEDMKNDNQARVEAEAKAAGRELTHHDHSRIRDHACALASTKRAADLAVRHNHRFHVLHVSTKDEAEFLGQNKEKFAGIVTSEVCHHHLLFNVDDYDRLGSRVQMNPSVKTKADNEGLWKALLDGDIDVMATDHAPHTLEEKAQPYPKSPSGLPAVENALALMLDQVNAGVCTLEQVVQWMCAGPAKVWDIANKGSITEGYDADLTLVDMNLEHTVRNAEQKTKCRWSPWDGVTLKGKPVRTWVMGHEVMRDGVVDTDHRGTEVRFNRS